MAMNPATSQTIEKYAVLAARYYFGAHSFISGINHYLLFFPDPLPMKPEMTGSARTIFTGRREVALNFGLLAAYCGYFRPIFFQPNLPLKPFWRDPMFGAKP
jgi:hypothetical protein